MDRAQLRSTAAGYPYLRGLFSVPAGLLFVLAALGNWSWGPLRHDWVFLAAAGAIAASALAIDRYYAEHFGHVTPSLGRQRRATAASVAGVVAMIGVTTLLRSRAAWSLDLPVNPIPAVFGVLMLGYYAAVVGLRAHHVLVWGAVVLAGLLPVWTGGGPSNAGPLLAGAPAGLNSGLRHAPPGRAVAPPPRPPPPPG